MPVTRARITLQNTLSGIKSDNLREMLVASRINEAVGRCDLGESVIAFRYLFAAKWPE